jgi:hypothetical protein
VRPSTPPLPPPQTVRFFRLGRNKASFKPLRSLPLVDFKTLFPGRGVMRPHGLAFKEFKADAC